MKVIVIGGSGFVGSRLCYMFNQSLVDFAIIDKRQSHYFPEKTISADISTPLSIDLVADASILINLAAEHRDDVRPKRLYFETNVQGAINICEFARKKNIQKIIFTSSVAVYGFAPIGTDESGDISPFNEYGRTKWEAEQVYKNWQSENPEIRTLVIVRPTVIFGEHNRGNVFNLLRQIAKGKFIMVGDGLNRKSMAYVENVAAFLQYSLSFKSGIHIYNYVDKPDFTMNELVSRVRRLLHRSTKINFRLPYWLGMVIGKSFDLVSLFLNRKFSISGIRVKKFCANSVYQSAISKTGFVPPVDLIDAIDKTVTHEFIEEHKNEYVFYTE